MHLEVIVWLSNHTDVVFPQKIESFFRAFVNVMSRWGNWSKNKREKGTEEVLEAVSETKKAAPCGTALFRIWLLRLDSNQRPTD